MDKIMIAVPTADRVRFPEFYDYLSILQSPPDTEVIHSRAHGQSPARNRNLLVDQAINTGCTHILFVDDDVIIPPDGLRSLYSWGESMVTGLYVKRSHPHESIIYDGMQDEKPIQTFANHPSQGLQKIETTGLGACLIDIEVFQEMYKPWFTLGQLEPDHWGDDIPFFLKANDLGFPLYLDSSVLVTHMGVVYITPMWDEGTKRLKVVYNTLGKDVVVIDAPRR